jgi:hypothetical protein
MSAPEARRASEVQRGGSGDDGSLSTLQSDLRAREAAVMLVGSQEAAVAARIVRHHAYSVVAHATRGVDPRAEH